MEIIALQKNKIVKNKQKKEKMYRSVNRPKS